MPGDWQLDPPPTAYDGDGSAAEEMDDGAFVTTWPDGTVRVDYPDGSSMITYSDYAVLNIYADGTRTLTDAQGTSYDPWTGASLYVVDVPLYGAERIQNILAGGEILGTLGDAKDLVDAAIDSVRGVVDPVAWAQQMIDAILEVIRAFETEERGCFLRGWSYGLVYGALDLGQPPTPAFSGSLGGSDQDELDRVAWSDGVARAVSDLADGQSGGAVRNRVLVQIAIDGGDPTSALRKIWKSACDASEDWQLAAAYPALSWPDPIGA